MNFKKIVKKYFIVFFLCLFIGNSTIFAYPPCNLQVGGNYGNCKTILDNYLYTHPGESDKYLVKYIVEKKAIDIWKDYINSTYQNKNGEFSFLNDNEQAWAPAIIIENDDLPLLQGIYQDEADQIINYGGFTRIIEQKLSKESYLGQKYFSACSSIKSYVYGTLGFEFISTNNDGATSGDTKMFIMRNPINFINSVFQFKEIRHFETKRRYNLTTNPDIQQYIRQFMPNLPVVPEQRPTEVNHRRPENYHSVQQSVQQPAAKKRKSVSKKPKNEKKLPKGQKTLEKCWK